MAENNKLIQIQKLFGNEAFVVRFNAAEDIAEIKKLFADNAVELTDDEVKDFLTAVIEYGDRKQSDELSAEEMENVVGGSWTIALIVGSIFAVSSGMGMYNLRKMFGR